MSGADILGIVTAITTAIVAIVGIIVRSQLIENTKEIVRLRAAVASYHVLALDQNETIRTMSQKIEELKAPVRRRKKEETYTTIPVYVKKE